MKKARRTEEQIIGILQEHEAGAKCASERTKATAPLGERRQRAVLAPNRETLYEGGAKRAKA